MKRFIANGKCRSNSNELVAILAIAIGEDIGISISGIPDIFGKIVGRINKIGAAGIIKALQGGISAGQIIKNSRIIIERENITDLSIDASIIRADQELIICSIPHDAIAQIIDPIQIRESMINIIIKINGVKIPVEIAPEQDLWIDEHEYVTTGTAIAVEGVNPSVLGIQA